MPGVQKPHCEAPVARRPSSARRVAAGRALRSSARRGPRHGSRASRTPPAPRRRPGRCSTRIGPGGRSRPSPNAARAAAQHREQRFPGGGLDPHRLSVAAKLDAMRNPSWPYGRIGLVGSPPDLSRRSFLAVGGGLALAGVTGWPRGRARRNRRRRSRSSALLVSNDLYVSPQPQRVAFVVYQGPTPATGPSARLALAPPGSNQGQVVAARQMSGGLPKGRGVYVVRRSSTSPAPTRASSSPGRQGADRAPGEAGR